MQSTDIAVPWDADDQWTNHERREARESMRRALEAAKPYLIATWCLAKADDASRRHAELHGMSIEEYLRAAAAELTQAADGRTG